MCESILIKGFSDYIKDKNPSKILFSSEDQQRDAIPKFMTFYYFFSSIDIDDKTNAVILTGEHGAMTIKQVSAIEIDEKRSLLGIVVTIYCAACNSAQYTLCLCE